MQLELIVDVETWVRIGECDFPQVTPGASNPMMTLGPTFCQLSKGGSHFVGR